MVCDKLFMPLVSSLLVGTASASVQKSMIADNPNIIVGLLGILVTIGLWGLGHLITLSIKMSRVETQIEDIKTELADRKRGKNG